MELSYQKKRGKLETGSEGANWTRPAFQKEYINTKQTQISYCLIKYFPMYIFSRHYSWQQRNRSVQSIAAQFKKKCHRTADFTDLISRWSGSKFKRGALLTLAVKTLSTPLSMVKELRRF